MTRYTILGERRSGTNFLQQCITDNFNLQLDWLGGWKHFFGYNRYNEKLKNNQDVIYLCIVRNPIDYFVSFYNSKLMQNEKRTKDIETFLLSEFYSVYCYKNRLIDVSDDYNFKNNNKRYKNIFEMRSVKCRYILDDVPNLVSKYHFIRYEDLLDTIGTKFNLIKKNDSYLIDKNYVGAKINGGVITENYQVEDKIKQIIYNNIDLSTEHRMGYLTDI